MKPADGGGATITTPASAPRTWIGAKAAGPPVPAASSARGASPRSISAAVWRAAAGTSRPPVPIAVPSRSTT